MLCNTLPRSTWFLSRKLLFQQQGYKTTNWESVKLAPAEQNPIARTSHTFIMFVGNCVASSTPAPLKLVHCAISCHLHLPAPDHEPPLAISLLWNEHEASSPNHRSCQSSYTEISLCAQASQMNKSESARRFFDPMGAWCMRSRTQAESSWGSFVTCFRLGSDGRASLIPICLRQLTIDGVLLDTDMAITRELHFHGPLKTASLIATAL